MGILLISHVPFAHVVPPFPVQHGGKLQFKTDKHDVLPRPIVEAIETAHQSLVEFFPVRITGRGFSLDYLLIPERGQRLITERQAVTMRSVMLANIEQILLAHQSLLNFTQVKFETRGSS